MDVLKIFQLRHSNAVAQPVYQRWNFLLPSDFCTVNAYRLHTSLSWDKLIFLYSVTKMPRRWCHFILVKLHKKLWRQEERSRVGTSSSGCSLEEVCMFASNACRLHTWHHDVMLGHFLLYSVTELSRRWWHFILVELHKICLKEEERSGMAQFFRKNYVCLPDISRCCFIYSFKQVVRNSLATFSH